MSSEERGLSGAEKTCQLVTFRLGQEEFAIEILHVQEILRLVPITPVPQAQTYVEGVINLRGRVIPVIDLGRRLGVVGGERGRHSRIMVITTGRQLVGVIVDGVREVLRISTSCIEPPPPLAGGMEEECIQGVGKLEDRLLVLLDPERLFSPSVYDPSSAQKSGTSLLPAP
jgi:purine-binding chemotaxis protein CheW